MLSHQIHNVNLRKWTHAISPNTSRSISTL